MRVLVTGGAGYIGSHTCLELLNAGHEVVVVEGVIVEDNCVISMGVYIGQSTKIYDRATGTVTYGRIPAGSVVVSGNLPSSDGKYSLYCAVIVKRVDAQTRAKNTGPKLDWTPPKPAEVASEKAAGLHRGRA